MNYQEMKEMLQSNIPLTKQNARAIIKLWQKTPKFYYNFLQQKNAAQRLGSYIGVGDGDDANHLFMPLKSSVPAPKIAEKFFCLEDYDITESFISVISQLSIEKKNIAEICAWPYMQNNCMKYLKVKTVQNIIANWHFLFDFAEDKKGYAFNSLYQLMDIPLWQDLLAANSVNVFGWVEQAVHYDLQQVFRHFLMAEHCMNSGLSLEAIGRKFYIQYRLDVTRLLQEGSRQQLRKNQVYEN